MSRIAKAPVALAKGVEVDLKGNALTVKGPKGTLSLDCNREVEIVNDGSEIAVKARSGSRFANAIAGTTRALINNMVTGVSDGFERKLELVGVGYRANAQGNKINLTLGFSHPVVYDVPEGVTVLGQPAVPINECKRQVAVIQQLPDLKKRIRSLEQELATLKDQLT